MKKAFSLMELIVVCAMIGILTAGGVFGFNEMRKQQNLSITTEDAVQTLSEALNLSYSANEVGVSYYGLRFTTDVPGKYILFNNNGDLQTNIARNGVTFTSETITFYVPNSADPDNTSENPYFKKTTFSSGGDTATITVSINGSAKKNITVNKHSNIIKVDSI